MRHPRPFYFVLESKRNSNLLSFILQQQIYSKRFRYFCVEFLSVFRWNNPKTKDRILDQPLIINDVYYVDLVSISEWINLDLQLTVRCSGKALFFLWTQNTFFVYFCVLLLTNLNLNIIVTFLVLIFCTELEAHFSVTCI